MTMDGGWVRIGELSRRVGVSDHVLRAWERRYGLLAPVRTEAGYRLYSRDDERRVMLMRAFLDQGLSAAEAARAALGTSPLAVERAGSPGPDQTRPRADVDGLPAGVSPRLPSQELPAVWARLRHALDHLDESAAQDVLDETLSRLPVETVLRDLVLPYLREVGDRWHRGEATVAQEHVSSEVIRGLLTGLARGWGRGSGPHAVLACPPGERHDLALLAFGIILSRRGWVITFLGPDTPVGSVREAVLRLRPDVAVLAATDARRFLAVHEEIAGLAADVRIYLAGPGATGEVATLTTARVLTADPVTAAQTLTP